MAWILDTTIPDIYTDNTVQGNVHTCLEPPYPKTMWYVSENPYDVKTAATKDYHTPCLNYPYPAPMWYVSTNPNDVKTSVTKEYEEMGAFRKCGMLNKVKIPEATEKIGEVAFSFTALTEVTISEDCDYYPTTFPSGCEVKFY